MSPRGYRWVEHTAELELHIDASTEAAVFEEALRAFGELVDEGPAGDPLLCAVDIAASDRDVLLVRCPEELVFRAETQGLVPEAVEDLELTADGLVATLRGARPAPRGRDAVGDPADARGDMFDPARVFADKDLLEQIAGDRSLEQLQNVATLPGIVDAALAMPDIHQGYGFPVGGVAAMEPPEGIVSPEGVGYDINCGVRLLTLPLTAPELGARREALVHEISRRVPVGAGHQGSLRLTGAALDRVLVQGPSILVAEHGIGVAQDVERTESEGRLAGADPAAVSERARRAAHPARRC